MQNKLSALKSIQNKFKENEKNLCMKQESFSTIKTTLMRMTLAWSNCCCDLLSEETETE